MRNDSKIFVAGHRGLVGSSILRELARSGYENVVTRTSSELDLRRQSDTEDFFFIERPEIVILAAARVGGIKANNERPTDFIFENLLIETNVIDAAFRAGCRRLLFLGSSCIYPKFAPQPLKEEYLLTGPLEPTNDAYAVAKIAGIKMCQSLRRQHGFDAVSLMPTNLYGPGDNFDLESSHVLPALLRKFVEATDASSPSVTIWGSGRPRREFLFVDDLARAVVFVLETSTESIHTAADNGVLNVGTGTDLSILDLAEMISDVVGYRGALEFDIEQPDGTPRKLLDVSRMAHAGWTATTDLKTGIRLTLDWYLENLAPFLQAGSEPRRADA